MIDVRADRGLTFDGPAEYRIRARGQVPARWSDRFEGMRITVEPGDGAPITVLEGELADQASLAGVLRTLYELHMPVVSVECLRGTPASAP